LARLLRLSTLLGCIACGTALVWAGELKVDINREGKNSASTTATGYTQWTTAASTGVSTTGTASVSQNFTTATGEAVTVTLAQTAVSATAGGTGLTYTYYATGATTDGQKLVSDGVTVAPAVSNAGAQIQMQITGLAAGNHTLLTYHNAGDAAAALGTLAPLKVYLNGTLSDTVLPSIRATDTTSTISYLTFNVAGTSTVTTLLFAADTASAATTKNVVINGFEIDTPNSTRTANTPTPADTDEHVDADSGTASLSWIAALAGTAVSHDVYFGTNKAALQTATRTSAEFKGNQLALTFTATGLSGYGTYYWRVDEIDSVGNATKGTVWMFRPRQLAFPGAEGYGRFARGGRGGKVVHVTSIADYASSDTPVSGTLRYAIEQVTGARTIVFDVSGLITLQSKIIVNSPYITIAGQTAPGKGICVKKYTIGLSGAADVIVRNIRSRPGRTLQNITVSTYKNGTTGTPVTTPAAVAIDGMGMQGSDHCIFDHCSISWTIDEAFSSRSAKNITLQRTLISEALNKALHPNYVFLDQLDSEEHGFAASIGGDVGSFHHNLLAHCAGRNWSLAGGLDPSGFFSGRFDITNNVVYNWAFRSTDGGGHEVNFVNNYYKTGASTTMLFALNAQYDNFPGTQKYYFAGNVMPGRFDESTQSLGYKQTASTGATLPANQTPPYQNFVGAPFFSSYVSTQAATDAYKRVLSDVGCNQPLLDDHDLRVVNETLTGTTTYAGSVTGKAGLPDVESDVGGWENYPVVNRDAGYDSDGDGMPDWWESAKGLNPNSTTGDFTEANTDPTGGGFTNLEIFLNWMAAPHLDCVQNSSVALDLSQLTRGYTSGPVFAVSGALNGTVALSGNGKTATFTPTAGFTGLASYNYTVTDSVGSTMSGSVNLRVVSAGAASAPTITTQPTSQTVIAGNPVAFTAAANGTPAPTFQWQKNSVAISGATNNAYTIPSVVAGDAGSYTVVATNSAGSATSNIGLLTVVVAPSNAVITILVQ
jgi:hypothetical protein